MKTVSYFAAPALYVINIKPKRKKEDIILSICSKYEVEFSELVEHKRTRHLVFIRHLIMYVLREKTDLTLLQIGQILDRDHTSVIHAIRMIENYLQTDSFGKRKEIQEFIQNL